MRLTVDQVNRILIGVGLSVGLLAIALIFVAVVAEPGARARSVPALDAPSVSATASPVAGTGVPISPRGAPIDAYQGLATWVDVYDTPAWRDPQAAVRDMARHGVRTIFVQTAHYNLRDPFFDKRGLLEFIAEGHAHGMKVVGWYLPNMKTGSVDYKRIVAAVDLRTPDGQNFDSFALDIESSDINSEWARNQGLKALSAKVRAYVGPRYALGAIIPAPVGLRKEYSVWHNFPYTMLASYYDVFVPMGYYTVHGHGAGTALADTRANLAILRSQPGCADVPVHLIGGIAEESSTGQVQAFVSGVRRGACIGASLYGWAGTSPAMWKALARVKR